MINTHKFILLSFVLCFKVADAQIDKDTLFYHYITTTKFENIYFQKTIDSNLITIKFHHIHDTISIYDTLWYTIPKYLPSNKRVILIDERREDNLEIISKIDTVFTGILSFFKIEPYIFNINKTPVRIFLFNDTTNSKFKIVKYEKDGDVKEQIYYYRNPILETYYNFRSKDSKYIWKIDNCGFKW